VNNIHINPDQIANLVLAYLPRLALALLTLVVGLWLIRLLVKWLGKIMEARSVEATLRPFLKSIVSIVLKILLLISVMGMIGIEMTSFIALLGATGISLGMALSGALQHFAGGVLILIYKPFKVGDFIEAQGQKGSVKEMRVFNTVINTIDNKVVFIPNGPLSTGTIVNYSAESKRMIEMIISVNYSHDIGSAMGVLKNLCEADTRILKDPAPVILVTDLAENAVKLSVRIWVNRPDYESVNSLYLENAKKEFDSEAITKPMPEMRVHVENK